MQSLGASRYSGEGGAQEASRGGAVAKGNGKDPARQQAWAVPSLQEGGILQELGVPTVCKVLVLSGNRA